MPHYALVHWQWNIDEWFIPGHVGVLDVRTFQQAGTPGGPPQGYALGAFPSPAIPAGAVALGDDLTSALPLGVKNGLVQELGLDSNDLDGSDSLSNALLAIMTTLTDPTGIARWKPVRISRRKGFRFNIGGQVIRHERFNPAHPSWAETIAVFQADYRRNRVAGELDDLRRWTGHTMQSLGITDSDILLPPEHRNDGWLPPRTAVSDNFNRDNESLDAGNWTEVLGGWSLIDNKARNNSGSNADNIARYDTTLSSDDHFAQATVENTDPTDNCSQGVICRKDNGVTLTYYRGEIRDEGSGGDNTRIRKEVAGTTSTIASDTDAIAVPIVVKLEVGIDAQELFRDAVSELTGSDTQITGNNYVGLFCNGNDVPDTFGLFDDFSGEDLAAAAAGIRNPFGGPMVLRNPLGA